MRLYTGTSGYSYKEWKGTFYPEDLKSDAMLGFYAAKLPAVEINNTFYRMPRTNVIESWASQVPEDFRFVFKATRRITHFKRLREPTEELAYMLGQFAKVGARLGPILFQLPPNMKQDLERLAAFLELLPDATRAAFEFRHATWFDDATYACLEQKGCALVVSDSDDQPEPPLVATTDWGYLRLRRAGYEPAKLAEWIERIRSAGWKEAFVFFKHEDEGAGPELAAGFREQFEVA